MRELSTLEMAAVSGGILISYESCASKAKGNNGWGNGAEGTNNGSFSGGTAGSKSDESWDGLADGPRPDKFSSR